MGSSAVEEKEESSWKRISMPKHFRSIVIIILLWWRAGWLDWACLLEWAAGSSARQATAFGTEAGAKAGTRWYEGPFQGRLLLEFVVVAV